MADTKRSLRRNDGAINMPRPFLVDKKKRASGFSPVVERDIVYRFAWQKLEPRRIAERLSTGVIRATTADVHDVLRRKVREAWNPEGGGLKAA